MKGIAGQGEESTSSHLLDAEFAGVGPFRWGGVSTQDGPEAGVNPVQVGPDRRALATDHLLGTGQLAQLQVLYAEFDPHVLVGLVEYGQFSPEFPPRGAEGLGHVRGARHIWVRVLWWQICGVL